MTMKKDNRSSRIGGPAIPAEHQQAVRDELARRGVLAHFNNRAAPLENSLAGSADSLYEFFHSNGYKILRTDWENNTISAALREYNGWIYSFYGDKDFPIYVGETGRTFMARFNEHKKEQPWWPTWKAVKVMPCPNQPMRKVFESLIGLAGGYGANKMQPTGGDNLLDDIILSLLVLGNESNQPPAFPNEIICNLVELVRSSLELLGVNEEP